MPTYEYICDACEHEFEEFQSITAKSLKKCPECGKNKLRRLIGTGAGIIFKGSGFYQTDYRSDGYNKDKKADGDSKSEKSDKVEKTEKTEKTEKKDTSESKAQNKSESKLRTQATSDKPKPTKSSKPE